MPGLTPATVACFGIAVVDRVYRVDSLPNGEGKYTATGYAETGGGPAATAAVAIAALGGRALVCGAVGDDPAGTFLLAELRGRGVDVAGLAVLPGRTPSCAAIVDRNGERCLVVDPGTVVPKMPDPSVPARAAAVLVDHRFPGAAAELLRALPPGVIRVLDAEGGEPETLRRLAALVDYPIFSRPGLRIATEEPEPENGLLALRFPDADACAVTLGEAGSLWLREGAVEHVPAPAVPVRDTTGCGDVFHGAFTLAMAEGRPWREAVRFASAAAALKARNGGGWYGMPDRAAVEVLMRLEKV